MRRIRAKALIVGINYYKSDRVKNLFGCVDDAYSVKSVLERDADGTKNFDVLLKTATDEHSAIDKRTLKDEVKEIFNDDNPEIALFYFSGHGYLEDSGGYLVTSDCEDGDEGMLMSEILEYANRSNAINKIIILDCCHSGKMAKENIGNTVTLADGMTILTASTDTQYASEVNGSGLFTNLLVDALNGGAANILGSITPGSVYAHIDQSLGWSGQRPVFRTNVKTFISLREVLPSISLSDLKLIIQLFPDREEHLLDPSYEPTSSIADKENCEKFEIMQKYNRIGLVVPIEEDHMYYAAINSKSCKLTALGEHYWNLIKNDRI